MISIRLVLMVLTLVCLFAASLGVDAKKVSLGWLGMFFWALSLWVV